MDIRLDWLLRAAWISATLPILIASFPSSRLNSFHQLLLGFSRRGKTMQPSSHFTVPQRFFLHFYLVGVALTTFLLIIIWGYAYKLASLDSGSLDYSTAASQLVGGSQIYSLHVSHFPTLAYRHKIWISVFLLLLMEMQVLRRLYETVYVLKYSSSARMHIFGYLVGLFFYTVAPLTLCYSCAFEAFNFAAYQMIEANVKNQQTVAVDFDWWRLVKPFVKLGWCHWVGAAIFAWGWLHQLRCHAILGSLREDREQNEEYGIPRGDWFEIVSSPHYLAEMIIYLGMLIASGGTDFIIWLLLLFVVI
ncbi:polyprenol reductase 2 isoform X2 [Jatropha curcas]|uniref:polyprenol reductase 2 isoform X2 n=1 Tax=Jatropha curcas TaxID=180498 RepID=UPI0005FBAFE4|nr:polyprenol reductase 2 isoform X2 [Jatropha curcas]